MPFVLAATLLAAPVPFPGEEPLIWSHASQETAYLGVVLREVTADDLRNSSLKEEAGAVVIRVEEGSPAAKADFKEGDVIVQWNRTPVESALQLKRFVRETPPGRKVTLNVVRDGKELSLRPALGTRPPAPDVPDLFRIHEGDRDHDDIMKWMNAEGKEFSFPGKKMVFLTTGKPRLGVELQNLSGQLAEYFGVTDGKGVLIAAVLDDSSAKKAGLRAGDIIVAIDGKVVENSSDLQSLIMDKDEGSITIKIIRDRKKQEVKAELGPAERTEHCDKKMIKEMVFSPGDDGEEKFIQVHVTGEPDSPEVEMKNIRVIVDDRNDENVKVIHRIESDEPAI